VVDTDLVAVLQVFLKLVMEDQVAVEIMEVAQQKVVVIRHPLVHLKVILEVLVYVMLIILLEEVAGLAVLEEMAPHLEEVVEMVVVVPQMILQEVV
tara:strand:- start:1154 stop:1441 length:288 start_codon:yes stop_codon:yes gene_type:complete